VFLYRGFYLDLADDYLSYYHINVCKLISQVVTSLLLFLPSSVSPYIARWVSLRADELLMAGFEVWPYCNCICKEKKGEKKKKKEKKRKKGRQPSVAGFVQGAWLKRKRYRSGIFAGYWKSCKEARRDCRRSIGKKEKRKKKKEERSDADFLISARYGCVYKNFHLSN